jgi:Raf kinase inhibitor-like YbhB/YbcL family protein
VITSPAFRPGAAIPLTYSCFGANQSPPLRWRGVPAAAELALVVDDPDAVGGRYLHWVVVGIAPTARGAPAGEPPPGATVLPNSGGERAYLGPCPPAGTGTHHYRFALYALNARTSLGTDVAAVTAEAAIKGSAVATTVLVGRYAG